MDADFYLLPGLKAEVKAQLLPESANGKVAYCRLAGVTIGGRPSNNWQWRLTETNPLSPPRFELAGGNNDKIVIKKVPSISNQQQYLPSVF